MNALRVIRRIFAVAVALWALALAVFYLFFAKISFESTTATGTPGQPPVITNTSGQIPWISQAQPVAVAFMLAFSVLLFLAAVGIWRSSLTIALPLSLLALAFSFITGFSIGGLYFPGAAVAFLAGLLLVVEKIVNRSDRRVT
jgi:hypothetical protein